MVHSAQSLALLCLSTFTFLLAVSGGETPESCTAEQDRAQPCRCCKIGCWYTIASAATHELGHIPGQAGEEEAMATLKLIRACMISECSDICPAARPFPRPRFMAPQ